MLYPQESESRDVRSLDGIWNFRLSPETDPLTGFRERWFQKDLSQVSVLRRVCTVSRVWPWELRCHKPNGLHVTLQRAAYFVLLLIDHIANFYVIAYM